MAHTLTEQMCSLIGVTDVPTVIHDILTQQFGYTQKDDGYYYSPIDSNFGLKFSGNISCSVTFDGGVSFNEFIFCATQSGKTRYIAYHASKNEKVIYFRIHGQQNSSTKEYHHKNAIIIAHDEKNRTSVFAGRADSYDTNSTEIRMFDERNIAYVLNESKYVQYKVNVNFNNIIFRHPPFSIYHSTFSELYGIVNIQTFPLIENTYININEQYYRIVSICGMYGSTSLDSGSVPTVSNQYPCFAFPVSD